MPQAQQPTTETRRVDLPLADRTMELRNFARAAEGTDAALARADLIFTTGAGVMRYDWSNGRYYREELVVEKGAIRMDRLAAGAPLLNTHDSWDLEAVLGVVDSPNVVDGQGTCSVTFSRRESIAGYVQDVADGVIRNVSVGYARHKIQMVAPSEENGLWIYRVIDWEPYEVSLVPIPADAGAQVRGEAAPQPRDLRTFPCEFIETRAAGSPASPTVGASSAEPPLNSGDRSMTPDEIAAAEAKRVAEASAEATRLAGVQAAAVQAEQTRSATITDLCSRHNVGHLAAGMIRANQTVDQARAAILDEVATRDAAAGGHRNVSGGITTVTDEHATRMAGVEEAVMHRVLPGSTLTDNGRQYRGMSLLEIGREVLEARGIRTRGMGRMEVAGLMLRGGGMLATGDFPNLFANVANKRLRNAYDENPGTYGRWARRAPNAPDFKSMSVVQLSGAPTLLRTNEHGEFKYGAVTDGAETYSLLTYGRIVSITRQAIVNDDLRGFDRLVGAFGASARRLENATVYSQLTDNGTMADTGALFNATALGVAGGHANLGTGALAIGVLRTMRAAMRVQKGLAGEVLNLAPAYLIVPAAHEQTAYELTSSNYTPATKAEVNEFRTGGRTALEPIVEPILDAVSATAWYSAAASSQIDTVEYCYLDGAEGPVIESEMGFEVDGMSLKARLDFAAKAVDFRGLYKGTGAG
jgi:hypothetical protein